MLGLSKASFLSIHSIGGDGVQSWVLLRLPRNSSRYLGSFIFGKSTKIGGGQTHLPIGGMPARIGGDATHASFGKTK